MISDREIIGAFHRADGPTPSGGSAGSQDGWLVAGICIFLAAITLTVFSRTFHHDFVNYDDNFYVYGNPQVTQGLSWQNVAWAFTHRIRSNWHPLTVISDMLDCQLYGLHAGGHHLTNVLLHALTVVLLFLVLRQMTGALWRSAFVAAVFAIHPLRVESVAWVAERKDVLSGVFFMLTLWAYASFARRPFSPGRYLLVVIPFVSGLMSKPMLVTLPFVLLLLDYWPLGRFLRQTPAGSMEDRGATGNRLTFRRLVAEKIPLLVFSSVVCITTLFTQQETMVPVSLSLRMGNAAISYITYLGQMVCPIDLAVLYPYPVKGLPVWEIIGACLLLAVVSAGVFLVRQRRPYLLAGWLWYCGMLVPVIGLVQVGSQARADRYTYLPQIGLYFALTWLAAEWSAGWRHRRWIQGGLAALILAGLSFSTWRQTAYWKNSESLWTRSLAVTADNYTAYTNLGETLAQAGRLDEAMVQFQQALKIKPDHATALNNVGLILLRQGHIDEAIARFQTALKNEPDLADAHCNLGVALRRAGRVDEAMAQYQKALEIRPDSVEAYYNLGNILLQLGRLDEAMADYQKALEIQPAYFAARSSLGLVLLREGRTEDAVNCFHKVLETQPNHVPTQNILAWILATSPEATVRNGAEAVELAERADRNCSGNSPIVASTLAAAYAEAGRFPEAVATARRAQALAQGRNPGLAGALQNQLELYQKGIPYREAGPANGPAPRPSP